MEGFVFTAEGESATPRGAARTLDGAINTRQTNGSAWMPMQGLRPVGTWELALPNTEQVRNWFKDEDITDILFVIAYSGRTPALPG